LTADAYSFPQFRRVTSGRRRFFELSGGGAVRTVQLADMDGIAMLIGEN
jgi:hypothetical protein